MRNLLIAAAATTAFAAPAAAQSVDPRAEEIVRALPAPEEMEAMGAVIGNVADALMDVPVGPLIESIDPEQARSFGRDDTLGALAADGDPYFRERMRGEIADMSIGLGIMTERFAALMPVLVDTIDEVQDRLDDALHGHPGRRR